jgi:hypothetical protein
MDSVLEFRGLDRRGAGVMGSLKDISAATFVQRKFKAGWQELRVTDAADDRLVGGLDRIDGKRIWWAEG